MEIKPLVARGGYTILSNIPAAELAMSRRGVGGVADNWGYCFWHLSVSADAHDGVAWRKYMQLF